MSADDYPRVEYIDDQESLYHGTYRKTNDGPGKVVPAYALVAEQPADLGIGERQHPGGPRILLVGDGVQVPDLPAETFLALAAYVTRYPSRPIDEEQVTALAQALAAASDAGLAGYAHKARRLVELGWTNPEVKP